MVQNQNTTCSFWLRATCESEARLAGEWQSMKSRALNQPVNFQFWISMSKKNLKDMLRPGMHFARPARPATPWLPRTALAPKIFKTALPHPENAPSLTIAPPCPEDFAPCPVPPHPTKFFLCPVATCPEAKKRCPVHPWIKSFEMLAQCF